MKTVVTALDELFGNGMVSFIRDPTQDVMTVSVHRTALSAAGLPVEGWKWVMGSKFCVRTMKEKDWENYVLEAIKTPRS